jgi:hypothetical protein
MTHRLVMIRFDAMAVLEVSGDWSGLYEKRDELQSEALADGMTLTQLRYAVRPI